MSSFMYTVITEFQSKPEGKHNNHDGNNNDNNNYRANSRNKHLPERSICNVLVKKNLAHQ